MGSALIDNLFPEKQANAIKKIWEDKESQFLLEKQIGKKLLDSNEILDDLPLTQLMLIASLSPFASNKSECHNVASIMFWGIHTIDILPLVTEHQGKQLAYRCLISLSLFKKALIKKWQRYGAPSPDFYRRVGTKTFKQIRCPYISQHFYQWECFLCEMFCP